MKPRSQRWNSPAPNDAARAARRDWAAGWRWLLPWGVPALLLAIGAALPAARAWWWAAGFGLAGAACLVNFRRCGRSHCRITGPLFLLGAAAALLRGLGLSGLSWSTLLTILLIGCGLACAVEGWQGRYTGGR